ncbi:MAG: hypothetical protein WD648_06690 [Planctomycetaceae bacterium]
MKRFLTLAANDEGRTRYVTLKVLTTDNSDGSDKGMNLAVWRVDDDKNGR